MSIVFRCRCGQRVLVESTEPVVQCPGCRRSITVTGRPLFWGLCVLAVATVGLVAAAVATRHRPARPETTQAPPPPVAAVPPVADRQPDAKPPEPKPAAPKPAEPKPVEPKPAAVPEPANPVPPAGPPRVGVLQVEPAGRYRVGEVFEQQVVVGRTSAFGLGGGELPGLGLLNMSQEASYSFGSTLTVARVNADGSAVVEQKIHTAKLVTADADMRDTLADALVKSVGTKFELTIGPAGEVTKMKGFDDPIRVKIDRNPLLGGQSLRMWSLLSEDAWKGMAEVTFFQPEPVKPGAKWARPLTHDWGPLGSWKGKTNYAPGKPQGNTEVYDYAHDIAHQPARGGAGGLMQLEVANLRFSPPESRGTIRYDPATRRVTAAEERFHVRGKIDMSALGADVAVEVSELQTFQVTVGEGKVRDLVAPGRR